MRRCGLAERAAGALNRETPSLLDTRAAAIAETGRYAEAAAEMERAIALLSGSDGTTELEDYRARLELYRRGAPYREIPQAAPPALRTARIRARARYHRSSPRRDAGRD